MFGAAVLSLVTEPKWMVSVTVKTVALLNGSATFTGL
jgi:hypothetical protein